MADFALGLTKTAVEGTLSRVKSAIEEEANIKEKVQQDLEFITGEFEMMQSFLRVANRERASNDVVKTWVRQLRDLAYDVENCVEFVVHLDNNSTWWWRLVPSCMAPPRHLDEAAAEIKRLKARVEDVSQRNTRYNLIGDSGSHAKTIAPTEQAAPATTNPSAAFQVLTEVWEATMKWSGVGDLEKLINCEGSDDLQVISVWESMGAADLGKMLLFRKAYNDPDICQAFKNRAWVKLTRPFDPNVFLKTLLTQFSASSRQAIVDLDHLTKTELAQQVKQHKYLIILEELSNVVEWDAIRMYLPDGRNGSRIVVSTKQLGIALLCTGEPFQVSELTRFEDQRLCAISTKALKRRNGELIWQIRCRGVVPVWGTTGDFKSTAIHKVYTSIMHKSKQFEGVEFQRHSWVDVPVPFDLEAFSRRLLLNFRSQDLQVEEIAAVAMMGDPSLTQECFKLLHDEDCLVVINGLQSTHDWDLIKEAFLSKPFRGCIVVITNEQGVATHCVDDEDGALNINDLEADPVLCSMIKSCQYYGTQGKEASRRVRSFSIRREEAREWYKKFGDFFCNEKLLAHRVTSVWGTCAWKSDIVRNIYCEQILSYEGSVEQVREVELQAFQKMEEFTMFSWVNVEHPFNLTNFSWRLILDFHSDNLQAKRTVAFGIMEGQDAIQECCKFLQEYKCLVVIDGLCTTHEWDLIKAAFLSEPTKGCIIVITSEASVAKYIVSEEHQAFNVDDLEGKKVVHPLIKVCASRLLSNRSEEARNWTNTFTLVGCQIQAAEDLANNIISSGVTAMWGIAGVGKSALVRSVYCHAMLGLQQIFRNIYGGSLCCSLHQRGFTMFSWVDVPHPFNLTEFSRRLLLDFHSDDIQVKEAAAIGIVEGHDPIQGCRRIMSEQRCLIVIDGLQSKDDWDLIKAAFIPYKADIVVVTNEERVAMHCVDEKGHMINVKGLEDDSALNLFKKITCGGKEMSPNEMELSKHIISKCGGILKIIAAIAREITPYKDISEAATYRLKDINVDFIGALERNPRLFHSLRGLFAWMQSYFEACSDSLKPCIFYMSVFPAKHNIKRRHLLRRWIAEGYSRDTSGRVTEENAERLFSELVNLSIIQQQESEVLCQVNGFFHEYIISQPMEDNLVFALEGHCNLNSQHAGQHLTIRSSWDRDEIVFRGIDFSRLRSLTVFGEWKPFLVSEKMRLVRVLDLTDASGVKNDDLDHVGKLLPRLKFLCLRGRKEISHLPESLSGLRQLQTLDVRHTSIVTLPQAIIKLHKLQYIRAGTDFLPSEGNDTVVNQTSSSSQEDVHDTSMIPAAASNVRTSAPSGSSGLRSLASGWLSKFQRCRLTNGGVKVPFGIGKLTSLHTLGVVNVNVAGGKAILKELKNLTQLRKLGVSGINRGNWHDLCSAISGHAHLESLSVQLDKDKEGLFARFGDISSPPRTLKSIKFHGHVLILPIWMKQLDSFKKGNLEMTILTQEDADALEVLPFNDGLRCLCVKPIQDGELQVGKPRGSSGFRESFTNMVLKIDCTSRLHVSFGAWLANGVKVLMVHCSRGSSLRISGLENLWSLKEVLLKGSYDDELEQDVRQQIFSHENKPVLKPEPRSS